VGLALTIVERLAISAAHGQAGDRHRVASQGVSPLLGSIDEFGCVLPLVAIAFAVYFWTKAASFRRAVDSPLHAKRSEPPYSSRRATIGSTRMARRTGK
jgi:hypothetical protein